MRCGDARLTRRSREAALVDVLALTLKNLASLVLPHKNLHAAKASLGVEQQKVTNADTTAPINEADVPYSAHQ